MATGHSPRPAHNVKDLTGQRFGRLLVERFDHVAGGDRKYLVRCDCGATKIIRGCSLTALRHPVRSCGCLKREVNAAQTTQLEGKKFGRLTVLGRAGCDRAGRSLWEVECSCADKNRLILRGKDMLSGNTRSCGCVRKEMCAAKATHGATRVGKWKPEYRSWSCMIQRCTNPNNPDYADYGGRGIKVCERWLKSFADFLADVGTRPSHKHSLDRYPDGNGSYERTNVRWATKVEQMNNVRSNHRLTFNGEEHTIAEWGRITGIPQGVIYFRAVRRGWTLEKALTTPVGRHTTRRKVSATEKEERRLARQAVTSAVRAGKLPRVWTLPCHFCSEPAKHYHHWKGYSAAHALDVIPTCYICHAQEPPCA